MLGSGHKVSPQQADKKYCLEIAGQIHKEANASLAFTTNLIKDNNIDCDLQICGRLRTSWVPQDQVSMSENLSKLKAIDHFEDYNFIFTAPNADHDNSVITDRIKSYSNNKDNIYFHRSFGQNAYLSFLNQASGVVGNSSSGLLEAPYCEIGTVNIGDRQKGRIRHKSVIDVENNKQSIIDGINIILSHEFRKEIKNQVQSLGDGKSGSEIVSILENKLKKPSDEFLKKEFFDLT